MTNPTPTAAALAVDELLPPLTGAEKPEAVALVLMRAVMKAERDTKPSTSYLLDLYAECLDAVYGDRNNKGPTPAVAKAAPGDRDARSALESALTDIHGVSETLRSLAEAQTLGDSLGYVAGQLCEHHDAAMDAFCRIFKLDRYSEGGAA